MEKLGIGIVGCGGIATAKHIPTLLKDDRVQIRCLCDSHAPSKAREAKVAFSLDACQTEEDFSRMLAREDVQVVHVCTPNQSHAPLTIQALKAGKHVLCEKPMATCAADALAMDQAARESGRLLSVCTNNRFRADSWHLKQLCQEGALGHIYYAKAHALRRRGVPTWGAFLDPAAQGGGPLIDIGFHALDLALWMMDNYQPRLVLGKTYDYLGKAVSQANPYGPWDSESYRVEDLGLGMIQFENGATVMLEASWLLNLRDEKAAKVTLCGTRAGADMDGGLWLNGEASGRMYDQKVVLDPPSIPFYPLPQRFGPELEMRLWVDAVLSGGRPVTEPYQAITVMRILESVYRSAALGQAVLLEDTQ